VCAVKVPGWGTLFCLGAKELCDVAAANFDGDACRAKCDAKWGADGGTADGGGAADGGKADAANADASRASVSERDGGLGSRCAEEDGSPWFDGPALAEADETAECDGCEAEVVELERRIAELEAELALE